MGSDLQSKDPCLAGVLDGGNIGHHHVNLVINDQRKWSCQENKIITGCYLLSDTKVRGYIKCMLNFGLKAVCFGYQNKD